MKIQGEHYAKMLATMKAVVEFWGVEKIKDSFKYLSNERMLWDVWHLAHNNLQYDDSHPLFAGGHWPRIYPCDATFKMYVDGLSDDHYGTALRKIGLELGLVSSERKRVA